MNRFKKHLLPLSLIECGPLPWRPTRYDCVRINFISRLFEMLSSFTRQISVVFVLCVFLASTVLSGSAQKRKVIADQDAAGPGGSDMMSLLVFLQSPDVDLLGISVVTGDGWRDAEVAHTLRLLESVGRTDVKVYPGAAFPLVRTQESTRLASQLYGKVTYLGAWSEGRKGAWNDTSDLREGQPQT